MLRLDVVIFGGGGAGLWLLDALLTRGYRAVLLEADRLGQGQTACCQGILHGGLKYTLDGVLSRSAAALKEMPALWRDCLAARRPPHLAGTRVRAGHCHLWRTQALRSRLAMAGARVGLRVTPRPVAVADRPPILAGAPGTVARLDEQVIDPVSFLADLAHRHIDAILKIDPDEGLRLAVDEPGRVTAIELADPAGGPDRRLEPRAVVFAAGAGNAALCGAAGVPQLGPQQRRPLHMVMMRGELPQLNGHCVDGGGTRVTITADTDAAAGTVWQVGGAVAEHGVEMEQPELLAHAAAEIRAVLPDLDLAGVEWSSYRVDRAEAASTGRRPDDVSVAAAGNVYACWPTKLALVPRLAHRVADALPAPQAPPGQGAGPEFDAWPRPEVALAPWETQQQWSTDVSGKCALTVSPVGFGAFKIGRNEGIKYPRAYDLPDDRAAGHLLNAVLDLGINYIDTAPAYGLSEHRIGQALAARRGEYVLSTKVGETFEAGRSTYDFSSGGVRASVERSLRRLGADVLDLVFIHSDGNDLAILDQTDAVSTLHALRSGGLVRAIGFSAKTVEGARAALAWADAVMVEYHLDDTSQAPVIAEAAAAGVGVVIKKGLAAGRLDPAEAVQFVLGTPGVGSLVVGSLNLDHLRQAVGVAENVGTAP